MSNKIYRINMSNETEVRWTSGQDEYRVEEIEYMLQSQRAMIYNDINKLMQSLKVDQKHVIEILLYLRKPRKVKI